MKKSFKVIMVFVILVLILSNPFWLEGDVSQSCKKKNQNEKMLDIGGAKLYFKWINGNKRTILLEAGGGFDSRYWDPLINKISEKTGATVVTYDRAGFGKSDLPNIPCDMKIESQWLMNGLKKLGLNKNLILVGHSYGGWMIKAIGDLYPELIIGMVFIDPFSAELVDLLGVEFCDKHPMMGNLPFKDVDPKKLTKVQRALIRMVGDGLKAKTDYMRSTIVPEKIPIILLSSGRSFLPKPEEFKLWRKSHEIMASKIKGIKMVIAKKSGHNIAGNEPDLVINSIVDIVKRSHIKQK